MQTQKIIAILLVIAGILMLVYTGFNYVTMESVVDVGPIQIDAKKNNFVSFSPIIGGILLIAGIILFISGKKAVS